MKRMIQKGLCVFLTLSLLWTMPGPAYAVGDPPVEEENILLSFLTARSDLLKAGYTQEELTVLYNNLSAQALIRLSVQPRTADVVNCVVLDYFREEHLERYIAYAVLHPDYTPEDIVTFVNIGMDRPRYENSIPVADPNTQDVLVNQYHTLGADYAPELVPLSSDYTLASHDYLQPEAYQWFIRMANAARNEGLTLRSVSAYRSYATQSALYEKYVKRDGVTAADRYSARPGSSEHQTGLALDINVAGTRYHFENTSEYQWLLENCWDYGFILRYPSDKTHITGYIYEPWHYRYVGIELAQQIRESGLTYDEFVARQPVEKHAVPTPPSFNVDGQSVEFSSLFHMDGTWYLSVNDVAQALGWSCIWTDSVLTITAPHTSFSLSCSDTSLPCTVHEGQLYMELTDLLEFLQLSSWQKDNTLLLSTLPVAEGWTFTDVLPYHPWYAAVCYVWEQNLFSGTNAHTFAPDLSMTRGMAVTVLRKLDPKSPHTRPSLFSDVADSAWYAPGVSWAASAGIVDGYPDGLFRPDQELTRQEAAQILFAFTLHMGRAVSYYTLPTRIPDVDQVADWAQTAFSWAYRNQLLLLRNGGMLAPDAPITRAEMAHAISQLCQNVL